MVCNVYIVLLTVLPLVRLCFLCKFKLTVFSAKKPVFSAKKPI